MARSLTITLGSGLGINLGPNFTITADIGSVTPNTATRSELIAGKIVLVDDNAQVVIITSVGQCTNSIQQVIPCVTTSTTSTTSTSTSTTSTTSTSTSTTSTTTGTTSTTTAATTTTTAPTTTTSTSTTSTSTSTSTSTTTTTTHNICDCYTYTLSNSNPGPNNYAFEYKQCGTGITINALSPGGSTINFCAVYNSFSTGNPGMSISQGAACTDANFCPPSTSTTTTTTTIYPFTTTAACPDCGAYTARKSSAGGASGYVTFMDCNGAIQQLFIGSQVPRNFVALNNYPITWTGALQVGGGGTSVHDATLGDWVLENGCAPIVNPCQTQRLYLRNTGTYGTNYFCYVDPATCNPTYGGLGPGGELFLDVVSGSFAGLVSVFPMQLNVTGSQCCISACAINNISINCVTGSL